MMLLIGTGHSGPEIGASMVHDLTWQSPQIMPEPNSGCWLWLGTINQHGYGRTRLASGRTQVAHRAVYEHHHQINVPVHLQVDHLCRNRCCVNPDHLEVVTRLENMRRAFRPMSVHGEDHCINGHKMTEENFRLQKGRHGHGHRICRLCKLQSRVKYRANLKLRNAQTA